MITHRTLEGGWAVCAAPGGCKLQFHFPDVSPEQMAQVPDHILWDLCEVVDPPGAHTRIGVLPGYVAQNLVVKSWSTRRMPFGAYHRGYDLPAVMRADGSVEWAWEGQLHREAGPAVVYADGRPAEYWRHGARYKPDVDSPGDDAVST